MARSKAAATSTAATAAAAEPDGRRLGWMPPLLLCCAVAAAFVAIGYGRIHQLGGGASERAETAGTAVGSDSSRRYDEVNRLPRGLTPLMRLAAMGNLADMERFLQQTPAPRLRELLATQSEDGQTCLHYALQGRMNQMQVPSLVKKLSGEHEEVIRALLDAGADPMVGHLSALWYSASYRNVRAMQLFLRPGTWPREAEQKPKLDDYADGGWSLLHEVVASKASGMARFFMKSGGPSKKSDPGAEALIDPDLLALMGLRPLDWDPGEPERYSLLKLQDAIVPVDVSMLLEAAHVVDWTDESGRTALHIASGDGVPGAVLALLKAGASVDIVEGRHGMTPLHRCAASGAGRLAMEVAQALIHAGADRGAVDVYGRTPADLLPATSSANLRHLLLPETGPASSSKDTPIMPASVLAVSQTRESSAKDLPRRTASINGGWSSYREESLVFRSPMNISGQETCVDTRVLICHDLMQVDIFVHNCENLVTSSNRDGACEIDVIDADELTLALFERSYLSRRRPLLIRGGARIWTKESSSFRWSRKEMAKLLRKVPLSMGAVPYASTYGSSNNEPAMGIKGYLASLNAFDSKLAAAAAAAVETANQGSDAAQERISDIEARLRQLAEKLPPYIFDGQITAKLQDNFDSLFDPPPPFFGEYSRVLTQLTLGSALAGAPPHFHGDAWNAVIYGAKRWFIFEPSTAYFARPRQRVIDWVLETGGQESMGTAPATSEQLGLQCMQEAGDIIYIPRLWGHAVLNVQESVGFAIEFEQQ